MHVKLGQLAQRKVDLCRGAAELEAPDGLGEVGGQVLLADEAEERPARVGAGDDHVGLDFLAAFEHDASSLCRLLRALGQLAACVRISAPKLRAAAAIAALTDPLPPLAKPQARNTPSSSPM